MHLTNDKPTESHTNTLLHIRRRQWWWCLCLCFPLKRQVSSETTFSNYLIFLSSMTDNFSAEFHLSITLHKTFKLSYYFLALSVVASVTRFAEISSLPKKIKNFCQIVEGLFILWQNLEPILANFNVLWQLFPFLNSQILKNNLSIWSHW